MTINSTGLLAGCSLQDLRERIERPPLDAVYRRMEARWREAAGIAARGEEPPGHASLAWRSVTPMAMQAAFIWRVTGNADAVRYVEGRIEKLAQDHREGNEKPGDWRPPVLSHGQIALATDMCREGLRPDAHETVCRLAREHMIDFHDADAILHYRSGGRNIPICQTINAAIAALVLGEECGHPGWEEVVGIGRDACIQYLRRGFDQNGFPFEGTGYGLETAYYVYLYAQLLRQSGREDLFASEPNLSNIPLAALSIMLPDRSALVNVNDLGLIFPWSMPWLLLTARAFDRGVDRGLWDEFCGFDHAERPAGDVTPWFRETFGEVTRGFDHMPSLLLTILWWRPDLPSAPVEQADLPLAACSPGVQMANFRTSWRREATYLNVLGSGRSHTGAGHAHADCGHFSLFAHGEYLAVDTGRYNVDEDHHNVVLVDGKCHRPQPPQQWGFSLRSGRLRGFRPGALVDYVIADSAHMKDCIWSDRHVLFVRTGGDDAYVVTVDNINPDYERHSYLWQLHAHPDARVEITGPASASIVGQRAALDVHFLFPRPEDFPDDPHTLKLRADTSYWALGKKDDPGVEARATGLLVSSYQHARLVAELTGESCLLMAVMVPRRRSEAPRAVESRPSRCLLRAEVALGGVTDTVLAAPDHGFVRQDDLRGHAELALVRRDEGGRVLGQWVSDGEIVVGTR